MKLSLIVPCYNEEGNVGPLADLCIQTFAPRRLDFEMIFVNDGSRDGTRGALRALHAAQPCPVKVIDFSRNFGKEAAIFAGLEHAAGDYIAIIDADLQQHPAYVLEMVDILDSDPDVDCVAAYQEKRKESGFMTWCKKRFYGLMGKACCTQFHEDASDFRTFRRSVAEAILTVSEYHRFSKGIFSWVGFNNRFIPYQVQERHSGTTSWSFWKLVKYAIEGIVSFTTFPLKIVTVTGTVLSLLSLLYMIVVVVQKLAFDIAIPGYPTIIVLILLIGGIQMLFLGLLGEYIARIYIQGKHRPVYIAREYLPAKDEETKE